jgi:hypothetical protein
MGDKISQKSDQRAVFAIFLFTENNHFVVAFCFRWLVGFCGGSFFNQKHPFVGPLLLRPWPHLRPPDLMAILPGW